MMTALAALLSLCPHAVDIAPHVEAQARSWRVPAALLVAVARVETHCEPGKVSRKGAVGRWQILPGGSAAWPLRWMSPAELARDEVNAWAAARHLARWKRTCGRWDKAVLVYHGGDPTDDEGKRRRVKCSDPIDGYTREVMGWWAQARNGARS